MNLPDARIDISKVPFKLCLEDSVWLNTITESAQLSYKWKPAHFFSNNNRSGIWGRIETAGYVTLEVEDAFGCRSSDSVLFNPEGCCTVTFPTAFTPNNDGRNDRFRPIFKGFHRFRSFRVVNRWGQTVYETINSDGGWDGTLNGVPQDMGVYYYFITFDCEDGKSDKEKIEKGEVTLIS
jgi:gliding motility-associated-like protein